MTKKDVYGSACCSLEFGKIFQGNPKVVELAAHAPPLVATQEIDTNDMDRRTFIKVAV